MSYPLRILLTVFIILLFLARLSVGGVRDNFPHWKDIDGDMLDAREQALYLQAKRVFNLEGAWLSESDIKLWVVRGIWVCPYTGEMFTEPSEMDADHVVPLKWAWDHGADKWTKRKRELFANDQFNILVVDASANRSKGARGPEEWLPANLAFAGFYILKFMQVCEKYDLEYPKKLYQELYIKVTMHKLGLKLYKLDCE